MVVGRPEGAISSKKDIGLSRQSSTECDRKQWQIVHEESFGPILPVIKFDDQEQANRITPMMQIMA